MTLWPGTVIGGKYVVERRLGAGGMGSVWLCRHSTLDAPFAVKILRQELTHDATARARFEREAKAAAALRTRHVVKVHDHGFDGEHAYIVMEVLEGEDLRQRMRRLGRLGRRATCTIVGQAARALHYAHAAGIVHRDLKPANIFIANVDGEEVVKILDFGIAKINRTPDATTATQTGTLLGSPHYMSPEQIRGHWSMVDHRTDLWALGVVVFRALTGQLPFLGEVVGDVMIKICIDPIPRASRIAPDLTPEVDAFFERALGRDREARFRSGLELATALATALGVAVEVADPSWRTPTGGVAPEPPTALAHDRNPAPRAPEATAAESFGPSTATPLAQAPTAPRSAGPAAGSETGTLTDASSLQLGPPTESGSRSRWWLGLGAVLLLAAAAALAVNREPAPPLVASTLASALRDAWWRVAVARAAATRTPPVVSSHPAASESSAAASATSHASSSAAARPPRVLRGPPSDRQPKESFSDRFGY